MRTVEELGAESPVGMAIDDSADSTGLEANEPSDLIAAARVKKKACIPFLDVSTRAIGFE